ncbi:MAG: tetratricopeptide repeat protein [Bacteroidia bacterium]
MNQAKEIYANLKGYEYFALMCLERIGSIYQKKGDYAQALSIFCLYHEQNLKYHETHPHYPLFAEGVAISAGKLSEVYYLLSEDEQTLLYAQLAHEKLEQLYAKEKEKYQFRLSTSYAKLGEIYERMKKEEQALSLYLKNWEMSTEIYQSERENPNYTHSLAISCLKLGDLYAKLKQKELSLTFLEQYHLLSQILYVQEPTHISHATNLVLSSQRLGSIYQEKQQFEKALELFNMGYNIITNLYQVAADSIEVKQNKAILCFKIGFIALGIGKIEGEKHLIEAKEIWEGLLSITPNDIEIQKHLNTTNKILTDLEKIPR